MLHKSNKRTLTMHSKEHFNTMIPTSEIINAMKDLSTGAYKLLMYYYARKAGWAYDEGEMASTIGVTVRRVQALKRELTEKKYLLVLKGTAVDNVFVGRKAVSDWENPDEEGCE